MRAGLLILLSFAIVIAPSASVLTCGVPACGEASAHEAPAPSGEQSCCCPVETMACSCASCTDHMASDSSSGPSASRSCLCGQASPQNHETSQTESVGAEVRLALCVTAPRDAAQQRRGVAHSAVIARHDPHPEVRQPLLL